MIKLLHTADVHLDMPFKASGLTVDQARQRRTDILETFFQLLEFAATEKVDMVLIAGDLFDEEYLHPETQRSIAAAFKKLEPIPILISPGNHDPYHQSSPYRIETWPGNVRIFTSIDPETMHFEHLGLTVHGCAFTSGHVKKPVWRNFHIEHTRTFPTNIILTHGAYYESAPGLAENYLPISKEDLLKSKADYIALGHYHAGFIALEDKFTKSTRAAYPGSPEPLKWGTTADHGALLVEIDPDKNRVQVEKKIFAQRNYHEQTIDISGVDTNRQIQLLIADLISSLQLGKDDLLRVYLEGLHDPRLQIDTGLIQNIDHNLFALRCENKARPDYDLKTIREERSIKGLCVNSLLDRIESSTDEERIILKETLQLLLAAFDGIKPGDIPL
jgi:exonuclease SbcD